MSGHILQQRCLAYAGLSDHHQRPALTCPHSSDQPVQHLGLAAPAYKPCAASDRSRRRPLHLTEVTSLAGKRRPLTSASSDNVSSIYRDRTFGSTLVDDRT